MKQFAVLSCLVAVALCEAEPQLYGKPLAVAVAPRCVTQYETQTSKLCTNVNKKQCSTQIVQTTKTITEQKESCATVYKTVPEQSCSTVQKQVASQQCSTQTRSVPQTTYSTQCRDEVSQVCDQVASTPLVAASPVVAAGYAAVASPSGLAGAALGLASSSRLSLLRGKREADPQLYSTAVVQTPVCRSVTQKKCEQVPSVTTRTIQEPVCRTVTRSVPEQVCKTIQKSVPEQKCTSTPVSRQVPVSKPVKQCVNVAEPVCKTVTQQIPKSVCSQQAVAVTAGSYSAAAAGLAGAGAGLSLGSLAPSVAQPVSPFANKIQG